MEENKRNLQILNILADYVGIEIRQVSDWNY